MPTEEKISHLTVLVQKWMYELLTIEEHFELNAWYSTLEGKQLGNPEGIILERIEQRLNEMVMKAYKPKPLPPGIDIGKLLRGEK